MFKLALNCSLLLICIINSNANSLEDHIRTLDQKLKHLNLVVKEYSVLYDNHNLEQNIFFTENLQKINKKLKISKKIDNSIIKLVISGDELNSNIILLLPFSQNNIDIANFVLDGTLVNDQIVNLISIQYGKGAVRFFPYLPIANIANISMFSDSKNSFVDSGLAFNKYEKVIALKNYQDFIPVLSIVSDVFYPNAKVTLNGMSLGFTRISLMLSYIDSKMDPQYIKILTKTPIILNWSGLVDTGERCLSSNVKLIFPLVDLIYTNVKAKIMFAKFGLNIANLVDHEQNMVNYLISDFKSDRINELIRLIKTKTDENPKKVLIKMLLMPPIISFYNKNDFLLDGVQSLEFLLEENGLFDAMYQILPKQISVGYKKFSRKYSRIKEKADYSGLDFEISQVFNHDPDFSSLTDGLNLIVTKDKLDVIEEILLLS